MDARNYANTSDDDTEQDLAYLYSVSPISLVANATNIPSIRLYATQGDSVPHQQSEGMYNSLLLRDADVVEFTIQGINLHAFAYWHTLNPNTGKYVSVEVIEFLQSFP